MSNLPTKVTPMLRQWLDAKAKAKDAILLFRMGDFYELFGDDALIAAPVVDLTVTTRDRDKGDDAMPMAGFPHHQAPQYIAKLIAAGMKVAVCDQMEDPALARGIVKRDVTRIVTPGMVLEDESLDAAANNFLVAVVVDADARFGLCALDVSTGEMLATVVEGEASLRDEIARASPREMVVETDLRTGLREELVRTMRVEVRERPERTQRTEKLARARDIDTWLKDPVQKAALVACELALAYVEETGQGKLPPHLLPPRAYAVQDRLLVDPLTRAHLALTGPSSELRRAGTLLHVVDRTKSAAGGRRMLRLLLAPWRDAAVIEERLDRVEALKDDPATRAMLRDALSGLPDIERLVARAASRRAGPRDLSRLRVALLRAPDVLGARDDVDVVADLAAHLDRALLPEAPFALGGEPVFNRGYDADLDKLASTSSGGRDAIAALEEKERKATGIPTLKIRYTRVFGYTIEVTKAQQHKAPAHFIRKQTIANGERYVTEELIALEADVEGAEQRRLAREAELFESLLDVVTQNAARLLALAAVLADVDVIAALAEVAHTERWVRPALLPMQDRVLRLQDARHPIVEAAARMRGDPYVPSSVELSGETQLVVVTGPNMAGKSTMMRQVALIQLLAQAGSFVPAHTAELSLCDRIFTRIGASDDLAQGRSTFMVEMTETSHILRGATPYSLVLLDEIGRGTSTYDGLSIAWAVAEHLHDVTGCRTLFATHYHELTQLDQTLARTKNVHVVVKEHNGDIVFVRSVADGPAHKSYGIEVARLAGLPAAVIDRAKAVLSSLEGTDAGAHAGAVSAPRTPAATRKKPQMGLFEASRAGVDEQPSAPAPAIASSRALDRLRQIDVLRLTPLEAMTRLAELVDEARRER